jgi:transposase
LDQVAASGLVVFVIASRAAARQSSAAARSFGLNPLDCFVASASRNCHLRGHGRPEIKRVLFMAAMVAAKHDPQQRSFYERLLSQGKKPLVALTAIMRKLVVICHAVLRPLAVSKAA